VMIIVGRKVAVMGVTPGVAYVHVRSLTCIQLLGCPTTGQWSWPCPCGATHPPLWLCTLLLETIRGQKFNSLVLL
jgi:hypothetical protein